MKRLILGLAFAAVASVAVADDATYNGDTVLTEGLKGRPLWSLQSDCAGFFGATTNYWQSKGDEARAAEAKAQGLQFMEAAISRLQRDRGLSRADAIAVATPAVLAGRAAGQDAVAKGLDTQSSWNYARSACVDVAESSARYR